MPVQVSVFLLECRFQQIFGTAVRCGQRDNAPWGEARFQLLFHSPFCSEEPLRTHRPLSNKSDLPREAVKQQNYSLHRLLFWQQIMSRGSEVNWSEPHGWNRPQIDRTSGFLSFTGVICEALTLPCFFLRRCVISAVYLFDQKAGGEMHSCQRGNNLRFYTGQVILF